MSKSLKYVALITVDGIIYQYYGNSDYEFGSVEEKPTVKLQGDQLVNYPLIHTVNLIPMYSTSVEVPVNLVLPLHFMINGYSIYIERIYKKGGEAVIFQGTLNQISVLFRRYFRLSRKLRLLPPEINRYVPKKYLLFNDAEDVPILAMEQLQGLIFTDRIYEQSLMFIQQMEVLNEVHGDISLGNVMQDRDGNVKFIDFSRTKLNIGTSFYSHGRTDRQALAIVLLSYKYISLIKEHYIQLGLIYDDNYTYTLDKLYTFKGLEEITFFQWFEHTFPQDEQSYTLFGMIRST
jgi:serine/threonine protein kinase